MTEDMKNTTKTKIDWRVKLSSRKFWLAVIGFVTSLLITFNVPDLSIEKIAGLITAMGGLVAFIFAEGIADSRRVEIKTVEITEETEDKTV